MVLFLYYIKLLNTSLIIVNIQNNELSTHVKVSLKFKKAKKYKIKFSFF